MPLAQKAVEGHKKDLRFLQWGNKSKNTLVGKKLRERESFKE